MSTTVSATTVERPDDYPSRGVDRPTLTPRRDPVLHGDQPGAGRGPLDADQLRSYERDGFLVLPGLLGADDVAAIDADIEALARDPQVRSRPEAVLEPGNPDPETSALRSLFRIHEDPTALGRLAADPRLAGVARQLLGSDVYIHQSRINLKPGFRGKEFSWHSDFETWHTEDGMPRMRAVSCSVLLTENRSYNGPLLIMAGSHRWFVSCVGETPEDHYRQSLREQEIGSPDEDSLAELARRGELVECLGPPGTAVFFECNVMHGSNSNISPLPRRNVFLVYNSVENALEEPFAAPGRRPEFIASRTFDPV